MTNVYFIRDAAGTRLYRTYVSRRSAELAIQSEMDYGCRAPLTVIEYIEATPETLAAGELLAACERIYAAVNPQSVHDAIPQLIAAIDAAHGIRHETEKLAVDA